MSEKPRNLFYKAHSYSGGNSAAKRKKKTFVFFIQTKIVASYDPDRKRNARSLLVMQWMEYFFS